MSPESHINGEGGRVERKFSTNLFLYGLGFLLATGGAFYLWYSRRYFDSSAMATMYNVAMVFGSLIISLLAMLGAKKSLSSFLGIFFITFFILASLGRFLLRFDN